MAQWLKRRLRRQQLLNQVCTSLGQYEVGLRNRPQKVENGSHRLRGLFQSFRFWIGSRYVRFFVRFLLRLFGLVSRLRPVLSVLDGLARLERG